MTTIKIKRIVTEQELQEPSFQRTLCHLTDSNTVIMGEDIFQSYLKDMQNAGKENLRLKTNLKTLIEAIARADASNPAALTHLKNLAILATGALK